MPSALTASHLPPEKLTWTNLCALRLVDLYVRGHSHGPSMRELALLLRLRSHNSALYHILRLKALGLIEFERTERTRQIKPGSLRLTAAGRRALERYPTHARFPR